MNSPARRVLPHTPRTERPHSLGLSGNWPCVPVRGPSLFQTEKPSQFCTQIGAGDRGLLPYPVEACAAGGGQAGTAKSRTPFIHVDHFSHWDGSLFVDETKFTAGVIA